MVADNPTVDRNDVGVSLLTLGAVLLRRRRMIAAVTFLGLVTGLAVGLLTPRKFTSTSTFVPEGAEASSVGGLAAAASQFGIQIPTGATASGSWGPAMYVRLLHSRTMLESLALDTVAVAEKGGQRMAVLDLLEITGKSTPIRVKYAVEELNRLISAKEDKELGAVDVAVRTKWASVSLQLQQRLIAAIERFNREQRQTKAASEFKFVQAQAADAEQSLRAAEDRLQSFMHANRVIGEASPLAVERDRLQRDVALKQQVFTSLVQNREESRIRQVRDTPIITILEQPQLPAVGEPRGSAQKGILGGFVGFMIGALVALIGHRMGQVRQLPTEESRDFFEVLDQATPRMFRRRAS